MKKALLSLLLGIVSLLGFAQNWIEVGVDTQYGARFEPNDIEFVNDSLVLMGGNSYNYNSLFPDNIRNGFFKSLDGGLTWDTLNYFNSGFSLGENYQTARLDSMVYILQGLSNNLGVPSYPYNPRSDGYVVKLYNNKLEFQQTLVSNLNLDSGWLKTILPLTQNTLGMVMVFVDGGFYFDNFVRFDLPTQQIDRITLPVYVEYINDIQFLDSIHGYMACGAIYREQTGYLLKTNDGGRNWSIVLDNSTSMHRCVEFYDSNVGITSSGQGLMYFTRDAGFNWFPSFGIPSRFRAYDICKAGDNDAYAIGTYEFYDNGIIESYTQVYRSSNQGNRWCLVYEDTSFNNSGKIKISFSDENHGVASWGYNRLIYTTNGGGLTECVTGINEAENELMVSVYPNPSAGSFTIAMPHALKVKKISIYDLSGSVVFQSATPPSSLLVNGLSSGMYILQVQTAGDMLTQKLVVE